MLSTISLYMVVVSCFALVAGRTMAVPANSTDPPAATADRRKTTKHSKFDPIWSGNETKPASEERHYAYFALYDPVANQTKK